MNSIKKIFKIKKHQMEMMIIKTKEENIMVNAQLVTNITLVMHGVKHVIHNY